MWFGFRNRISHGEVGLNISQLVAKVKRLGHQYVEAWPTPLLLLRMLCGSLLPWGLLKQVRIFGFPRAYVDQAITYPVQLIICASFFYIVNCFWVMRKFNCNRSMHIGLEWI